MESNRSVYRMRQIVKRYQRTGSTGLLASERYCLNLVPATHRGSILDIGIGTGRTTGPLSTMFGRYVGIDFSNEMIAAAKSLYPDRDLRVMDARKLRFRRGFRLRDVLVEWHRLGYI